MNNYADNNEALDWDATIEDEGKQYVLTILDEGDYAFTVTEFARGQFPGSAKLPACNKAMLTLEVDTPQGTAAVTVDMILAKSLEWKLSSFFKSVGLKKSGEKLVMCWDKVIGTTGRAHFKPRKYTNKNGEERTTNNVEYFIDPDPRLTPDAKTPEWAKEAEKQAPTAPTAKGWKSGQF